MIFSLGIIFAGFTARIVRGAVLALKENVYMEAARSLGAPKSRIMLRYVLPNIMPLIIILASVNLGAADLAEATVSFLGFGIQRPFPTWGGLLDVDGRVYGVGHEWLSCDSRTRHFRLRLCLQLCWAMRCATFSTLVCVARTDNRYPHGLSAFSYLRSLNIRT